MNEKKYVVVCVAIMPKQRCGATSLDFYGSRLVVFGPHGSMRHIRNLHKNDEEHFHSVKDHPPNSAHCPDGVAESNDLLVSPNKLIRNWTRADGFRCESICGCVDNVYG
jgi:hypothetical protein